MKFSSYFFTNIIPFIIICKFESRHYRYTPTYPLATGRRDPRSRLWEPLVYNIHFVAHFAATLTLPPGEVAQLSPPSYTPEGHRRANELFN